MSEDKLLLGLPVLATTLTWFVMSEGNPLLGLPVLATTLTWFVCLYCFQQLRSLLHQGVAIGLAVVLLMNVLPMLSKEISTTSESSLKEYPSDKIFRTAEACCKKNDGFWSNGDQRCVTKGPQTKAVATCISSGDFMMITTSGEKVKRNGWDFIR